MCVRSKPTITERSDAKTTYKLQVTYTYKSYSLYPVSPFFVKPLNLSWLYFFYYFNFQESMPFKRVLNLYKSSSVYCTGNSVLINFVCWCLAVAQYIMVCEVSALGSFKFKSEELGNFISVPSYLLDFILGVLIEGTVTMEVLSSRNRNSENIICLRQSSPRAGIEPVTLRLQGRVSTLQANYTWGKKGKIWRIVAFVAFHHTSFQIARTG
jgi:hypothetical protein